MAEFANAFTECRRCMLEFAEAFADAFRMSQMHSPAFGMLPMHAGLADALQNVPDE